VEILPDGKWVSPSVSTPQSIPKKRKLDEPFSVEVLDDDENTSPKAQKLSRDDESPNGKVSSPSYLQPPEDNGDTNGNVKQEFPSYPTKSCFVCKSTGNTKRCSKCKSISYCGKDCQYKDWERHRTECYPVNDKEVTTPKPNSKENNSNNQSLRTSNSNNNSRNQTGASVNDAIVID